MAVETPPAKSGSTASTGRRVLVGANVVVASLLVLGIVAVLQYVAYAAAPRFDMTRSGINSLSDGTERLLRGLDGNIRLTSLYFETDVEEEDQQRYRRAVDDLLGLYASTNRSHITAEHVNPLSDHEKVSALKARLRERGRFKDEVAAYAERIDVYRKDGGLDARMRVLASDELDRIGSLSSGLGEAAPAAFIGQIENVLGQWGRELEATRRQVDALATVDNPQYGAAAAEIESVYREFSKVLKSISQVGSAELARDPSMAPAQAEFVREAGGRYADLVAAIEVAITQHQELEPLELDDLLRKLVPTGNPILVETDDDAVVVDFTSVWPPLDPNVGSRRVDFKSRSFKGEEKLTSAILRATHKEQTAVVFVRYGGPSLFMGGFLPGQPPAPYSATKQRIEDVNFLVEEWDLKTTTDPPEIEPAPTRTIYVVFKPTPPQRGPMGQPSSEPPFADAHKQALIGALGDEGRALFIGGWMPGPFPGMPSSYEYNDYLEETWGIKIDTSALLIETVNISPGRYQVGRRDFFGMRGPEVGEHDIVSGAQARLLYLPWCAPLDFASEAPEGVERVTLVTLPARDGLWGVKNIRAYEAQIQQNGYMTKEPGDLEGPFDLAAAASKGEAKVVVVASREFAVDQVAFAQEMVVGAQGFSVRSRNPGNVTLLVNALYWLNDNTEFMNIGKPIDAAVLEIESTGTVRAVQVLTIFVWPALAFLAGGAVWWIRRR